MNDGPADSPNMLRGGRMRRGVGVRRLNRVPLIIAAVMLCLIGAAVIYTYQMRIAEMQRRVAEARGRPEAASGSDLFSGAPFSGLIEADRTLLSQPPIAQVQPASVPAEGTAPIEVAPNNESWEDYRRRREELAAVRAQRLRQAIAASTRVTTVHPPAAQPPSETTETQGPGSGSSGQLSALYTAEAARQRRRLAAEDGEEDINRAAQKRAFLTDRPQQSQLENYLPGGREAPSTPFEVKAGTVIPAIMIGGVSSDLPGQIIGQVSENIYDTATGRHILIPQGSKLIGSYDNAVTTGQERILVAWTRIIYPDASSLDLGKMPGTDASGFAGFHDKVNDHIWAMFGNALLLSVFSAGVQISQGGQNSGADGLTPQQSIAAGLGQQFGQLGQELARRNSRIQPTLEVRPGYRFTVMVTKDMALRPWRQ